MLTGSTVALVTPFTNGSINRANLKRLFEIHAAAGTDYILVAGTTGESATLSHEQHQELITASAEIIADMPEQSRPGLMAGAGSNSTREAVELTAYAVSCGVDYVLSITPYYNKPPQRGLVAHFKEVASAAGKTGVVLYTVPSRTGVDLELDTVLELAQEPNIVSIKEASGKMGKISEIVRQAPEGFTVVSGEDNLTLPMLALGCKGVVSVTANVAPVHVREMVHAALDGDWDTARARHHTLFTLTEVLFSETNPIPTKTAIAHWSEVSKSAPGGGQWPDTSEMYLPLVPMSSTGKTRLLVELEKF